MAEAMGTSMVLDKLAIVLKRLEQIEEKVDVLLRREGWVHRHG